MTLPTSSGTPVGPGDVLAGKYRVERVLGQGGMGVVVAATQLDLGRTVALKFLLRSTAAGAEEVVRFLREARIVGKLRSEHVAGVYELGQLENGEPYMAMEYLEGMDLTRLLTEKGPLHFTDAAAFVRQACDAIGEAHSHGVVHRDLKPANLFRTTRPNGAALIKVLDFGISKSAAVTTAEQSMTRTTAVLGSPYYMSPEQLVRPKTLDYRTDVWSLGVILYELVTGKVPFDGETLADLALKIHHEEPRPIASLNPTVPASYQAIVTRCLKKDRELRFASVLELSAALEACDGSRSPDSSERVELPRGQAPAFGVTPQESTHSLRPSAARDGKTEAMWSEAPLGPQRPRSNSALVGSVVGVAVVLGVAAAVYAWRAKSAPASDAGIGVTTEPRKPGKSVLTRSSAAIVPPPSPAAPSAALPSEAPASPVQLSPAPSSSAVIPRRVAPTVPGRTGSNRAMTPRSSSSVALPSKPSAEAVRVVHPPGWDEEMLKP